MDKIANHLWDALLPGLRNRPARRDDRIRTGVLLVPNQARDLLRYIPERMTGFEPATLTLAR